MIPAFQGRAVNLPGKKRISRSSTLSIVSFSFHYNPLFIQEDCFQEGWNMTSYEFCQRMLPQDSYSWKPRVNHLDPRRRSCCPCDGGAHWLRVTLKSLKSFEGPKKPAALALLGWKGVFFLGTTCCFVVFFPGEQVYIYILWILCTYVFEGMIRFI